jgi:glucose-6-phosphate isomerase
MSGLTSSPAWKALEEHKKTLESVHMRELFSKDANRFSKFSLKYEDILVDFSKNRITEETLKLLINLAKQQGVEDLRDKMFNGEKN